MNRMIVVAALLAGVSACTLKDQAAPPLSGPSELAKSITMSASPDVLTQDGVSQSVVTITARDGNSQPIRNLGMRADVTVGGVIRGDFGMLSSHNIVTDSSGTATLIYTAPLILGPDTNPPLAIQVIPNEADFGNATPRTVNIRLLPKGTIGAPQSSVVPSFTVTPANPNVGDTVVFDASATAPQSAVATYAWTFGDGGTASGVSVTHSYNDPKNYLVTLTVTDTLARTIPTTKTVAVGAGANPTPIFTFSPTPAAANATIFFDASASVATPGHTIVSYNWTFGDGNSGSGVSTTHAYATNGTYAVTLTVADDAGRTGVSTQQVAVGAGLTPAFTFTPGTPAVNVPVFFDGSTSTPTSSITSYAWDFGDFTGRAFGPTATHTFQSAGNFTVTLTVGDAFGHTAQAAHQVTVTSVGGSPTASFTSSPAAPAVNDQVHFNASTSTATQGHHIAQYSWDFGDGSAQQITASAFIDHSYNAAGTYTVTLVVTDEAFNRSQPHSQPLTVSVVGPPTAAFTFSPANATAPASVHFNASGSTAAQSHHIVSYSWDFGDGTTAVMIIPTIDHPFASAGTYTVTLVVIDELGDRSAPFSLPVTLK